MIARITFALLLAALGGARPALAVDPVRFSATPAWTMPFAGFDAQGDLADGILFKLYTAVAQQAGLPHRILTLPRKRTDEAFAAGELDLRCFATPAWIAGPGAYACSRPIFADSDVVVRRLSQTPVTSLTEIERSRARGHFQRDGVRLVAVLVLEVPVSHSRLSDPKLLNSNLSLKLTTKLSWLMDECRVASCADMPNNLGWQARHATTATPPSPRPPARTAGRRRG